jgi:hypothetical protein
VKFTAFFKVYFVKLGEIEEASSSSRREWRRYRPSAPPLEEIEIEEIETPLNVSNGGGTMNDSLLMAFVAPFINF